MNEDKNIFNFTRGVPPVDAFPTQQLQECASSVLEKYSSTVLQYHPAMGYLPLREWVGVKHNVSPNKVLVSNGSLQLQVFLSEALTSPGDTVFVEKPSYDRAITAFQKKGLDVIGVPLEKDGFEIDALEELVKIKNPKFFYIIPDFQNPSGISTSQTKRVKLIELAEKYDFWILEDNPYRDLRYWGEDVPTIFSLGSEKSFFFSSFSKVLSPGLRVGYLIGPEALVKVTAKIAEDTYITPNMLSQGIVYDYCRRGWLEPGINRLKELYRPRLETIITAAETYLPQANWSKPEGGFFLGVDFPPDIDLALIRSKADQMGIKLSDGNGFFSDSSGDSFLRLPFCALSENEIQEGVRRLGSLID